MGAPPVGCKGGIVSTTTDNLDLDDLAPVDRLSVKGLARNGAIAGGIKLASAGLSFLMFVVVALVTDERQFGLFSAAYAGASLVSFFNTLGQQSAVLRFWPEHSSSGNLPTAHSFMARSLLVAGAGALASVLLVCAIGLLPWFQAATPGSTTSRISCRTLQIFPRQVPSPDRGLPPVH